MLIFLNWCIEFYVYVNASDIALGTVLEQFGEGNLHHPIYFTNQKSWQEECNYIFTSK
jgi:hypothetical protein